MTNTDYRIFIAGHNGMVGSAIRRELERQGYSNLILKGRKSLDLTNQSQVHDFFSSNKIDQVYICAAQVGGIHANSELPAEFLYKNLQIQNNVINSAFAYNVKKILFLGSSCIYPKNSSQPIDENQLLSGYLEKTNEPYAIAKIAGIKLCESYNKQYSKHGIDYRSVMPTNLYGPGDNYHPNNSHVIPGLINRFHAAKLNNDFETTIWGSGKPMREFLYVDDMAKASIFYMNLPKETVAKITKNNFSHINVGYGDDISISNLSKVIAKIVGYKGLIHKDNTKPDGTTKKLLDSSLINKLGWYPTITLEEGLKLTYEDFKKNYEKIRR